MTAQGLLIAGDLHTVPGLNIVPPASHGGPAWCRLDPDDYTMRRTAWIRQLLIHSTGGNWPQPVIEGAGPAGHAQQIAEMWSGTYRSGECAPIGTRYQHVVLDDGAGCADRSTR